MTISGSDGKFHSSLQKPVGITRNEADRRRVHMVMMPPVRRLMTLVVALTACVVLAAGCFSSQTASRRPSTTLPTPACTSYTAEATRLTVTAFLDAYNAGAPDVTDRFIAPAEQFQWYGAPGRQFPDDPVATDRATLPAYFASQHAKGDKLELKSFSWSSITYQINGGVANFGYTLIHRVAGGAARDAPGKGALACASGKIAVWLISSW